MKPLTDTIITIFLMAGIIFLTRSLPFILFARTKPPKAIRFIERFIPPTVMSILVVYCLKDISWTSWPSGINELISLALVVALHLYKKNAMLSIFGGTALYILLRSL